VWFISRGFIQNWIGNCWFYFVLLNSFKTRRNDPKIVTVKNHQGLPAVNTSDARVLYFCKRHFIFGAVTEE
jgi:hypothetical protein